MTPRQTNLNLYSTQLEILSVFLTKYDDLLPLDFGSVSISSIYNHPTCVFCLPTDDRDTEGNREKALTLLGDVFGRNGWEAKLDYNGRYFNWRKDVDGVSICICSAKRAVKANTFPVPPSEFPILLQDSPNLEK